MITTLLVATFMMQKAGMSVFIDAWGLDDQDNTVSTKFFSISFHAAAAPVLTDLKWWDLDVRNVGTAAAAVAAPKNRARAVRKPVRCLEIYHFHVFSGRVNERLSRELMGVLHPCGGWLEANDVRSGVLRRTTSGARRPEEMAHIDLAGPHDASMAVPLPDHVRR